MSSRASPEPEHKVLREDANKVVRQDIPTSRTGATNKGYLPPDVDREGGSCKPRPTRTASKTSAKRKAIVSHDDRDIVAVVEARVNGMGNQGAIARRHLGFGPAGIVFAGRFRPGPGSVATSIRKPMRGPVPTFSSLRLGCFMHSSLRPLAQSGPD
mgnify:CR=1 FL=1